MFEHRFYYGTVEQEGNIFFGQIYGIKDLFSYEAKTKEQLLKEFVKCVEEYIELKNNTQIIPQCTFSL